MMNKTIIALILLVGCNSQYKLVLSPNDDPAIRFRTEKYIDYIVDDTFGVITNGIEVDKEKVLEAYNQSIKAFVAKEKELGLELSEEEIKKDLRGFKFTVEFSSQIIYNDDCPKGCLGLFYAENYRMRIEIFMNDHNTICIGNSAFVHEMMHLLTSIYDVAKFDHDERIFTVEGSANDNANEELNYLYCNVVIDGKEYKTFNVP